MPAATLKSVHVAMQSSTTIVTCVVLRHTPQTCGADECTNKCSACRLVITVAESIRGSESEEYVNNAKNNTKVLQNACKGWFGTSGYITSWDPSNEIEDAVKCSTCGADESTKKCSTCRLVCYCTVDCQRKSLG